MNIKDFKFKLHDQVVVHELRIQGRVIGLYFCEDGKQYRVRYFDRAEARTVYFFEDEIGVA